MADITCVAVRPEEGRLSAWIGDKPAIESDSVTGSKKDIIEWESDIARAVVNRGMGIKDEFFFQQAAREKQSREKHQRDEADSQFNACALL